MQRVARLTPMFGAKTITDDEMDRLLEAARRAGTVSAITSCC